MQITREDTSKLTASIRLQVAKDDYNEKVNKTLKEYQRKANMPGFRPGKVPFGMVSKMYRKGVMLDEINHLLSENLQQYIEENKFKLIGNPIPNREKAGMVDLDNQTEFEFYFDIGFAPEFDVEVSDKTTADYYKIKATDKMIDEQIQNMQHRIAHENSRHNHDEEPSEDHHDIEVLPGLDQEFFSKVFPGEEIPDEAAFREKVRQVIEQSLVKESERYFMNTVIENLVSNTEFELPDDFLKKMIRENEDQKVSDEELESRYGNFTKSIRWQLIEARLIKDNDLYVSEEEIRTVVRGYFRGHISPESEESQPDERIEKIVDSVLSNKEESGRLQDQLYDQKLMNLFKTKLKLEEKEIDYDEFIKLVTHKSSQDEKQ